MVFYNFTSKIRISSLPYHSLCFCSSASEVPCVGYSCAWTGRLLSDSSSTRSNCSLCLSLGTLHTATPRNPGYTHRCRETEVELLTTQGHQQGSPLLQITWSPSILAKLLTLQNMSDLRPSSTNSHLIINSLNDNLSLYYTFSTLPSSLSGPFLIFIDFFKKSVRSRSKPSL